MSSDPSAPGLFHYRQRSGPGSNGQAQIIFLLPSGVCRRLAAEECAGAIKPLYAFVRNAMNPADRPSRLTINVGSKKNDCD